MIRSGPADVRHRRSLPQGAAFSHSSAPTDNDTEVAAVQSHPPDAREGATEPDNVRLLACGASATSTASTPSPSAPDGFAVLRDPIACKPAVMAETDDWVAMASEYRAIAGLPGRRQRAACGSPKPATVYWELEPAARAAS